MRFPFLRLARHRHQRRLPGRRDVLGAQVTGRRALRAARGNRAPSWRSEASRCGRRRPPPQQPQAGDAKARELCHAPLVHTRTVLADAIPLLPLSSRPDQEQRAEPHSVPYHFCKPRSRANEQASSGLIGAFRSACGWLKVRASPGRRGKRVAGRIASSSGIDLVTPRPLPGPAAGGDAAHALGRQRQLLAELREPASCAPQ
jgi:hypothetical protein